MGIEKRQSPRKELRIKAWLTMDDGEMAPVHTADIGKFGMGLTGVPEQYPMGAQGAVAFDLFLNGQIQRIDARLRIAYCIPFEKNFRAGVQFLELDSDSAKLIARYVED